MIETLISSKTRIKLLIKFFLNSSNTAYLRNLEEEFGESTNGIRLELNKFEKAGFLDSFFEGNKKIFKANTKHPLFEDINRILMKMVGVEYVMEYILQRVGDLDKIYLTGKLAKGQNADTIDLILIGSNLNEEFLIEQIQKAEKKIKKKIHCDIFSSDKFEKDTLKEQGTKPLLLWSKQS